MDKKKIKEKAREAAKFTYEVIDNGHLFHIRTLKP